jgi:hypothetical protein
VGHDGGLETIAIPHVVLERVLLAEGDGFPVGLHVAHVLAPGQAAHLDAPATEQSAQTGSFRARQIAKRLVARATQAGLGRGAHAPDATHRQGIQEGAHRLGLHLQETVRLGQIARDLGHHLDGCDSHRYDQVRLGAHGCAQSSRQLDRRPQQAPGAGDVQEGLVQGETLHLGGEAPEDLEDAARLALVAGHVPAHEGCMGTAPPGLGRGHGRVHAETARLVAGCGHHAPAPDAADDDGLAA